MFVSGQDASTIWRFRGPKDSNYPQKESNPVQYYRDHIPLLKALRDGIALIILNPSVCDDPFVHLIDKANFPFEELVMRIV